MSTLLKRPPTDFVIDHEGRDIYVEISPCSWMYAGYGLQIKLSTAKNACNAESVFDRNPDVKAGELSTKALVEKAHAQAVRWLAINGVGEIDKAVARWAKIRVRLDKAIEKERVREEKARIRRLKQRQAAGLTHVVDACIHPFSGDDFQIEACTIGEPTPEDIKRILAESVVKTDYKVSVIADLLLTAP